MPYKPNKPPSDWCTPAEAIVYLRAVEGCSEVAAISQLQSAVAHGDLPACFENHKPNSRYFGPGSWPDQTPRQFPDGPVLLAHPSLVNWKSGTAYHPYEWPEPAWFSFVVSRFVLERLWPLAKISYEGRQVSPLKAYTEALLRDWFRLRVRGWPGDLAPPTADACREAAKLDFIGLPGKTKFREIRGKSVPDNWSKPGPRQKPKC